MNFEASGFVSGLIHTKPLFSFANKFFLSIYPSMETVSTKILVINLIIIAYICRGLSADYKILRLWAF